MTSSLDYLSKIQIISPIVSVIFCGFRSTTLELQQNGWSLAMEQQRDFASSMIRMRLVMEHAQAKLYALAESIFMEYHLAVMEPAAMMEWFKYNPFQVRYVSPGFRFSVSPEMGMPKFGAIDARPTFIEHKEIDLADMKIFQPINPGVEILVEKTSVAELLKIIKTKQMPTQDEIRERLRKENARKDVRNILDGHDPRKDIKAQIVCVA